jgi:glycosyltransferase involved in cell wall biosynthesis
VGVLPALGSGLTDLARTGQHERLLGYDLTHYAAAFERVLYFSYFDESAVEFTRDAALLARLRVVPKRGRWPNRLYTLVLPLVHRREMRRCGVLRVLQFTGVIPALIARRLYGIPFAVTYGYHYGEVARLSGSRWKPWLLRLLERVAFPRAAAVIVTSREMERRLAAHPARPRLAYFPNGVDLDRFAPATRGPAERPWRQVLYAGRLEGEKNVARLIDALALVREPPVRLVVVGAGKLRGALARRARDAGVDVTFRGVVAHGEMPRLFADADCFVLPSLTEGHPKVLIEAMACGLPCAASARGGIPSMIEDEVTGLLFDPEDSGDIARAVSRLLMDEPLAKRLGARARAAAVAQYDARVWLSREAAFVRSLADGAAAPAAASSEAAPPQAGASSRDMVEASARAVPMDSTVPAFVAERLRPFADRPPRAVLDVGAGDGRFLAFYASLFPAGTRLVGCELSLLRARRLAAHGFRVVVAAAEALPFREGAFDLVTLMEVIEHTRSPARALDEACRVLMPGGRLALTTPNYPMKRLFDLRAALHQRRLARLRDDPTHVSPLSAGRLERLLAPRFQSVALEGTALPGEGHWRRLGTLRRSRLGRRLSNKLFVVCAKAGGPR